MKRYLQLLRNRPQLRRLWTANMISLLGDWLSYVAISLLALHEGGGILAVALVLVAYTVPKVLISPLAGRVADMLDRRTIMLATNVLRTVLTLGMAAAALAGSILWVEILLVARVTVSAFFYPARSAVLPQLVEREELGDANTLMTVSWSVIFTAGVALGGVLAAAVGPTVAIAVDAGTFVLATVVLWGLPRLPPPREKNTARGTSLGAALRYAVRRPRILSAVLGKAPIAFAGGAAWTYLNLAADELALGAALGLGALHASRALGTGIGPAVLSGVVGTAPWVRSQWFINAVALVGIAAFGWTSNLGVALFALMVWGAGSGALWVTTTTDLQRQARGSILGRLTGFDVVLSSAGMASGALLAAVVAERVGPDAAIVLSLALGLGVWAVVAVATRVSLAYAELGKDAVEHVVHRDVAHDLA